MAGTLVLPDGSSVRPYIIGTVKIHDDGVEVVTTTADQVTYIREPHPQIRRALADTISVCMNASKNFVQPDWKKLYAEWREEFGLTSA